MYGQNKDLSQSLLKLCVVFRLPWRSQLFGLDCFEGCLTKDALDIDLGLMTKRIYKSNINLDQEIAFFVTEIVIFRSLKEITG